MSKVQRIAHQKPSSISLTAAQSHKLAEVLPAAEWFANLGNANTRRSYQNDLQLAALFSLFEYLSDANAVTHNLVKGVRRPKVESYEGRTPAISDGQARQLLKAPVEDSVKGLRDRALLSMLLHHGLRREEVALLTVGDIHERRGVMHLRVHGKGNKLRRFGRRR